MIKVLSTRSNDLEIIFWDCAFHCVKLVQKLHDITSRIFSHGYPDIRLRLFILIVLINAGMILGILLGYLRNL